MHRLFSRGMTAALFVFVLVANSHAQLLLRAGDLDRYRTHYLPETTRTPAGGSVKVTFLGTTTLLFDDGETQILTDGFFTRPPMLKTGVGTISTDTVLVDAAMKRAGIDRLKAVFVAHSHYDHSLDAAYVARRTKAKLYGSDSTLNIGRGGDLTEDQMAVLEPGKEIKVGRFTVVALASKHTPAIKWVNDDLGQKIDKPLRQPARVRDYKEGGAFDFLIKRNGKTMLVKPSTNYIPGALDDVRADVLFLGTATLGNQVASFRKSFYEESVGKVRPKVVVPIHWDNFFKPLSDTLEAPARVIDDLPAGFDFLIDRLKDDRIRFGILQGYQSVVLFDDAGK